MTREEKRKKAIAIAVAYFVEQEKAAFTTEKMNKTQSNWMKTGRSIQMNLQQMIRQRGSISKARALFNKEESFVLS